MKPGARILAAVEVLDEVLGRHRPVSLALADWGKAHRFAGSGDRNAIGHMVYDALRRRASASHVMGATTTRALVIGALALQGASADDIAAMCSGASHEPEPLTDEELARLRRSDLEAAEPWVAGDYPEWLHPSLERAFGERAAAEGTALSERAPADIRVNTLKATREKVLKALATFGAFETKFAPHGVRVAAPIGFSRTPNLQAEAAFQAGWCEIQDEGSQLAAAMTGASPRMQVLDICAGAGGKTLALAAMMQNTGQLYAYDADKMRLKPIFDRVKRNGVRNVQIIRAGDRSALEAIGAKFDRVLVDAPCTGTGTWRRRPDAKWRLKADQLAARVREQDAVLADASRFVKPGGRLTYVTCSILPEENGDRVSAFLDANPKFRLLEFAGVWREALGSDPPPSADGRSDGLLLTPARHATDGFFVATLERAAT